RSVLFCLAATTAWSASSVAAGAEERVISMYHVHTGERITITYWKDGHFIPSALRKLNWFLRDWRKNRAIRIDPRTIDLVWKLHEDLGSKKPVQIISGHRSAATNAMLRRIGRKVARRSRHITGQAIDFRFPDVPTWKVRNLALAYGIGGVGYYGRNGFVHVDTGRVRHWPRLPSRKLAAIKRRWRAYIGYRNRRPGSFMIAAARRRGLSRRGVIRTANVKNARAVKAFAAAAGAKRPTSKALRVAQATKGPVRLIRTPVGGTGGARVPLPRSRPYQVLVMAASRMEIMPASAPATETNFRAGGDPLGRMIARVAAPELTGGAGPLTLPGRDGARRYPKVNRTGKGDLARDILEDRAGDVPTIRLTSLARASMAPDAAFGRDIAALLRRDGAPQPMQPPGRSARAGKGDPLPVIGHALRTQRVNRAGKGDLLVARLRAAYAKRRVPVPETAADRDMLAIAEQPLMIR
ncbi:MAG TPA: DUF882 domain-containing protein, partial [Thermopetrobacter sp.]|nr:DUF882 domain-containing protein [Thermopetrobacter sp.]